MKKIKDIRYFFKTQQTDQQSRENAGDGKSADTSPVPSTSRSEHFKSSENLNKQIPQSKIINDLGTLQTGPCDPTKLCEI